LVVLVCGFGCLGLQFWGFGFWGWDLDAQGLDGQELSACSLERLRMRKGQLAIRVKGHWHVNAPTTSAQAWQTPSRQEGERIAAVSVLMKISPMPWALRDKDAQGPGPGPPLEHRRSGPRMRQRKRDRYLEIIQPGHGYLLRSSVAGTLPI